MSVWTPNRIAIARREFDAWEGTPHRNRMAKKRVGVDCIHFVAAIYVAAGILPAFRFPSYDPSRGILAETNAMGEIFQRLTFCHPIEATAPREFGDVAIFRVGRVSNHVGIIDGDHVWHSLSNCRVHPARYNIWQGEVQELIRIDQDGLRARPEAFRV